MTLVLFVSFLSPSVLISSSHPRRNPVLSLPFCLSYQLCTVIPLSSIPALLWSFILSWFMQLLCVICSHLNICTQNLQTREKLHHLSLWAQVNHTHCLWHIHYLLANFLYCRKVFHCVCIPYFHYALICLRTFTFYFLTIVNRAAMNVAQQAFVKKDVKSLGICHGAVKLSHSRFICILMISRNSLSCRLWC